MKHAVLIYSGGLDSTTLLYEYQKDIACAISFNYGARHNKKELFYARYHCKKLAIPQIIIPLDFISRYFSSNLLKGQGEIPVGRYDNVNMRSTSVPFRNGIMLAIATGFAESQELSTVMIANHAGDHDLYPDCTQDFISAMNKTTSLGTYKNIKIEAPYCLFSKGDIVSRGNLLNIDYSKTWSCYKGDEYHCGVCGTCMERKEAFVLAHIKDTTIYQNNI